MQAKLSVNINKIALLRNSREGNYPDLYKYARDCEEFGAEGITVHPRPDQRHIRYDDIPILKGQTKNEFNIEGFPNDKFLKLVLKNKPDQCTLVPDDPSQLTSDHGWNTIRHRTFLKDVVSTLQDAGIRTSLFLDPDPKMLEAAVDIGTDRIELYTGPFAYYQSVDTEKFQSEISKHALVAKLAQSANMGVNAGHDLNLENLRMYAEAIPNLLEVSIGHALTVDALYYGLQNAIQMYKRQLMIA